MNIGIVGLGLMGGSLAIALKKFPNKYKTFGYDHNLSHIKEAIELGLVDKIVESFEEIKACDIIILAIPVRSIVKSMNDMVGVGENVTIIDFGSTKKEIVSSIPPQIRKNFVPSHPMTGTEKTGPTASIENLYVDKIMVVCDLEQSGVRQQEVALELFNDIGSKIIQMDSASHDNSVAFISHMPHALSFALVNSVLAHDKPEDILALEGGSFKSMSRISKSSPIMWSDIFIQNRNNLLLSLQSVKNELEKCEDMLKNDDWQGIHDWIEKANRLKGIL